MMNGYGHDDYSVLSVLDQEKPVKYIWKDYEYDRPLDFLVCYENRLPQLVQVPQGYLGADELHTVTPDELFVHGHCRQKRLVIQGPFGFQFSVPLDKADELQVYQKGKKVKKKLSYIIENGLWQKELKYPYKVVFTTDPPIGFCEDTTVKMNFPMLGKLDIVDVYEERYLIVNTVTTHGGMMSRPMLIPAYVPVSFNVVLGIEGLSNEEFAEVLDNYRSNVDRSVLAKLQFNKDIVTFCGNKGDDYSNYAELQPSNLGPTLTEDMRTKIEQIRTTKPKGKAPKIPKKSASLKAATKPSSLHKGRAPLPQPVEASEKPDDRSSQNEYTYARTQEERVHGVQAMISEPTRRAKSPASPDAAGAARPPRRWQDSGVGSQASSSNTDESRSSTDSDDYEDYEDYEDPDGELRTPKRSSNISKCSSGGASGGGGGRDSVGSGAGVGVAGGEMDDIYAGMDTYGILEALPRNRYAMNVAEVGYMLKALNMRHMVEIFSEEKIDGEMLHELTDAMLRESFDFTDFEVKKIRKYLGGWVPKR